MAGVWCTRCWTNLAPTGAAVVRHFNDDHGVTPSAGEIAATLARKWPIWPIRTPFRRGQDRYQETAALRSRAERLRAWKVSQADAHQRHVEELSRKLAEEQQVKKMSRKNYARMVRNRGRGILDDAHTPPSNLRKIDR